jgi:hypothetical protein
VEVLRTTLPACIFEEYFFSCCECVECVGLQVYLYTFESAFYGHVTSYYEKLTTIE